MIQSPRPSAAFMQVRSGPCAMPASKGDLRPVSFTNQVWVACTMFVTTRDFCVCGVSWLVIDVKCGFDECNVFERYMFAHILCYAFVELQYSAMNVHLPCVGRPATKFSDC